MGNRTLRRLVPTSIVACVALVASLMTTISTTATAHDLRDEATSLAGDAGASAVPACILVTTDARYVPYGYNHIVILKNGCSKAATCTVSTDVNPQPTTAEVASGSSVEVLTFSGSPANSFTARVGCRLR